jgi:hypothetical protein
MHVALHVGHLVLKGDMLAAGAYTSLTFVVLDP